MKYKITKNIENYLNIGTELNTGDSITFGPELLVKIGFAEEIKYDIDIEAIRVKHGVEIIKNNVNDNEFCKMFVSPEEARFIQSFHIVKAVIDQLNGEFEEDTNGGYEIGYSYNQNKFIGERMSGFRFNITPFCKDQKTTQKIIELCKPELKVLFGVE